MKEYKHKHVKKLINKTGKKSLEQNIIIEQHAEIERLKTQLEYASKYIPNEYKYLDGDIKDPNDFGTFDEDEDNDNNLKEDYDAV
jgi:hypothetical protein